MYGMRKNSSTVHKTIAKRTKQCEAFFMTFYIALDWHTSTNVTPSILRLNLTNFFMKETIHQLHTLPIT